MAFPQIQGTPADTQSAASSASQALNLPTGIQAGEQLLVVIGARLQTATDYVTFDSYSKTTLAVAPVVTGAVMGAAYVITATGSEGATTNITLTAAARPCARVYRFPAGVLMQADFVDTLAGLSANPPTLSPAWGTLDTTWLAMGFHNNSSLADVSTYPASYTGTGVNDAAATAVPLLAYALRELYGGTENPSAFTFTGTAAVGGAMTVGVSYPPPPTETMRPTSNPDKINLTGGVTTVDQDPDGAITDPGMVVINALSGTSADDYANGSAAATGIANQLTTPGQAVGTSEATNSATTGATQNADYANYFHFDEAAISTKVPLNAEVQTFTIRLRDALSTLARGDVGVQLMEAAAGAVIGTENTAKTGLTTALPAAGTGVHTVIPSTLPTYSQLTGANLGVRVRYRRTVSQAATYTLDWLRLEYSWWRSVVGGYTQADLLMADPAGTLLTGADSGEIRARVRRVGPGTSHPTGRFEVCNAAGTLLATAIPNTTVDDTDANGQLMVGAFDQSAILDKTDVMIRFVGVAAIGASAELVALEWNARVVPTTAPFDGVGFVGIRGQV